MFSCCEGLTCRAEPMLGCFWPEPSMARLYNDTRRHYSFGVWRGLRVRFGFALSAALAALSCSACSQDNVST